MSKHTEAQLLEAMAHATLPEQRKIRAELDQLRTEAARQAEEDREVDVANAVIEAHLTPVLVHGMHSTATDWLGEDVEDFGVQDLPQITSSMRVEASHWYRNVSPGVRANRYELREQARGVAARYASQYGSVADQAQEAFMQQVARLVVAEGTDMAGVPSAAGDNTNPELVAWSDEADDMGTNEGSPPPAYDAYTPVEGGGGAPQPQAPAPATSGDPGEPTDTAPSAQTTLPTEDTHNDPGDAAATGEIPPVSARYETAQQRAIRQYLAVEEGTEPPVPGVQDIEQDGEAGTTLPLEVSVSGHPESLDTFVPATPSKPAPSTRAPNVTGSRRVAAKVANELEEYIVRNQVTAATMTRQHFQHIADSISSAPVDEETRTKLAHHFADRLGSTNGQFQRQRFIDAATRKTASRHVAATPPCGNTAKHGMHMYRGSSGVSMMCNGTVDESKTNWTPEHGWRDGKESSRHEAVATGPNPQGSFIYDPIVVESKGYEEGFAYALTWEPGKPIPAAMTSAASIGNKYNDEYVRGYQSGVLEGIAALSAEYQSAFASAQRAVILSSRKRAADHSFDCPQCGVHMNWNEEGTGDPEPENGLCPQCADPYSDSNRVELWNEKGGVDGDPNDDPKYIDTEGARRHTAERRTLTLPYSEVCMSMGVAGQTLEGELTSSGNGVQLYKDGKPFSFPITTGEAGWDMTGSDHTLTDFDEQGQWFPKSSSLPQLQLADMDDSVSNPFTWSTPTRGGSGGTGAADVASVPTPGQGVADYPQPTGAPEAAVGEPSVATEPVTDESVANPAQVEAFRRRVRANLGR